MSLVNLMNRKHGATWRTMPNEKHTTPKQGTLPIVWFEQWAIQIEREKAHRRTNRSLLGPLWNLTDQRNPHTLGSLWALPSHLSWLPMLGRSSRGGIAYPLATPLSCQLYKGFQPRASWHRLLADKSFHESRSEPSSWTWEHDHSEPDLSALNQRCQSPSYVATRLQGQE